MDADLISQVSTIWAIGRNYADHAKEMGANPSSEPLVFMKTPACITTSETIRLPSWTNNIHHEIEILVRIGRNNTPSHIGLALDLTARDTQAQLKEKSWPWALAKSFTQSCPISPLVPFESGEWFENLSFELSINDTIRQFGETKNMIFDLDNLIGYLDRYFPLREGDLILTGTPEGVGPIRPGDKLHSEIPGVLKMGWTVH